MQKVPNVPDSPYSEEEFEEFIKIVGNRGLKNWSIVAEALGVSRKTISRWKRHPRAQRSISKAIQTNIKGMEMAGKNDWRMYREKLKMLGVSDRQEFQHKIQEDSKIEAILDSLETDYEDLAEKARLALISKQQN